MQFSELAGPQAVLPGSAWLLGDCRLLRVCLQGIRADSGCRLHWSSSVGPTRMFRECWAQRRFLGPTVLLILPRWPYSPGPGLDPELLPSKNIHAEVSLVQLCAHEGRAPGSRTSTCSRDEHLSTSWAGCWRHVLLLGWRVAASGAGGQVPERACVACAVRCCDCWRVRPLLCFFWAV